MRAPCCSALLSLLLIGAAVLTTSPARADVCPHGNRGEDDPIILRDNDPAIMGRFDAGSPQGKVEISIYVLGPSGSWMVTANSPLSIEMRDAGNWLWHPIPNTGPRLPDGYYVIDVAGYADDMFEPLGFCPLFFLQVGAPTTPAPVGQGWGDVDEVEELIFGDDPNPVPNPTPNSFFTGCPTQDVVTANPFPSFSYSVPEMSRVDVLAIDNRNGQTIYSQQVFIGPNGLFRHTLTEELNPGDYTLSLVLSDVSNIELDSCTYTYKVDELQYERCAVARPGAPAPAAPLLALGLLGGVLIRQRRRRRA